MASNRHASGHPHRQPVGTDGDAIRVLHVDDEPAQTDLLARYFTERVDGFAVDGVTSASAALDRLAETDVDCIVSDYNMPGMDGVAFLRAVREEYPDLPFILFTGRGSEEVASEAISAGVTEYLQKTPGTEQYELLANRIRNSVAHRRSERELAREQAFTEGLLDAMPDVYYLVDDQGALWRWNDRLAEVTGYPDTEIAEMQALEFVPERDQGRIMEAMLAVYGGSVESRETAFVTKDGEEIPYELNGAPVRDADGEIVGLVGTGRDISERVERERRLERYERILTVLPDAVCAFDEDGEITVVNDRLVELLDQPPAALVGGNATEFISEEIVADARAAIRSLRADADRDVATIETSLQTDDGGTIPAEIRIGLIEDAEGGVEGNVAVVRDRSGEARIERRLQALIENSPTAISVVDPDGTAVYMSPTMEESLGYAPENLQGENVFAYVHPDDREAAIESLEWLLDHPDETLTEEIRFQDATGDWQWVRARGSNHIDDPAVGGIVVNTEVVTERVEREAELERQNENLEQFAWSVSHDLRNPLNVIAGSVDLARTDGDSAHLDRIETAVADMEAHIEDLLVLARMGQSIDETAPVEVGPLVVEAWETVAPASATVTFEAYPHAVEADAQRLRQVFENLFANAVTHAGADVTVRVGRLTDRSGWYVADDGPGIPESERAEVFEKGYTTDDAGTGFGLAIVESVVAAHGWEIAVVESAAGGARFEIAEIDVVE